MLIIFRHFLLTLLLLLQLFAPLVHAHTQKSSSTGGLHVPGLEFFAPNETAYLHNAQTVLDAESLCIVMNTGIQHKSLNFLHDHDAGQDQFFCLAYPQVLLPALINKPPLDGQQVDSQQVSIPNFPSHAPRAPPGSTDLS